MSKKIKVYQSDKFRVGVSEEGEEVSFERRTKDAFGDWFWAPVNDYGGEMQACAIELARALHEAKCELEDAPLPPQS